MKAFCTKYPTFTNSLYEIPHNSFDSFCYLLTMYMGGRTQSYIIKEDALRYFSDTDYRNIPTNFFETIPKAGIIELPKSNSMHIENISFFTNFTQKKVQLITTLYNDEVKTEYGASVLTLAITNEISIEKLIYNCINESGITDEEKEHRIEYWNPIIYLFYKIFAKLNDNIQTEIEVSHSESFKYKKTKNAKPTSVICYINISSATKKKMVDYQKNIEQNEEYALIKHNPIDKTTRYSDSVNVKGYYRKKNSSDEIIFIQPYKSHRWISKKDKQIIID